MPRNDLISTHNHDKKKKSWEWEPALRYVWGGDLLRAEAQTASLYYTVYISVSYIFMFLCMRAERMPQTRLSISAIHFPPCSSSSARKRNIAPAVCAMQPACT